jgi:hypothetical protein
LTSPPGRPGCIRADTHRDTYEDPVNRPGCIRADTHRDTYEDPVNGPPCTRADTHRYAHSDPANGPGGSRGRHRRRGLLGDFRDGGRGCCGIRRLTRAADQPCGDHSRRRPTQNLQIVLQISISLKN